VRRLLQLAYRCVHADVLGLWFGRCVVVGCCWFRQVGSSVGSQGSLGGLLLMDLGMLIYGGVREWVVPFLEFGSIGVAAVIGMAVWGSEG
jgi:hypothetical protein